MSNRAWMPLHIADYLADTGHLTVAEHGAYMLLIMAYWQRGGLPTDERMIARMARMTPDQWAESRDVLADLFAEGWRHKRIDAELAKADEIIEKRKIAASAMHKRRKSGAHAEHMQSTCSDTRVPPLTVNQTTLDSAREAQLLEALGAHANQRANGRFIAMSEPLAWINGGCDFDADILPTVRALSAKAGRITGWGYFTAAVFEARDKRLAPAPAVQPRSAGPPRQERPHFNQDIIESFAKLARRANGHADHDERTVSTVPGGPDFGDSGAHVSGHAVATRRES